jgi:hypothetical protein
MKQVRYAIGAITGISPLAAGLMTVVSAQARSDPNLSTSVRRRPQLGTSIQRAA